MKFVCEHVIRGISQADYEKLYFDEDFNVAMCKAVNLDRSLIKRDDDGKHLTRHVKVSPRDREVPGPVAKIVGTTKVEYVEQLDYDWGRYRGTWRSISSIMTDKVESSGTLRFEAAGDGVKRIVDGDVKVKIFGVGGVIERFIIADVEKSYEQAAEFTRRWLAEKGKA